MLPEVFIALFESSGVRFAVSRESVFDCMPHLGSEQPRGWPNGSTFGDVAGAYFAGEKKVVVGSTQGPNGDRILLPKGKRHGSENLMVHEGSHAFDAESSYISANDEKFVAARAADLSCLSDYEKQDGGAGKSETFAEQFAMFVSVQEFKTKCPSLTQYFNAVFKIKPAVSEVPPIADAPVVSEAPK